ncbi:hypothetical protein B0H19DRAFT_1380984 [Mycena capillaripes]|nr:hypothetical protein B0H19DRAFT_1380984 [Mycena capillaripes]
MQLITRIYVLSVLCLASLAAPLTPGGLLKPVSVEAGKQPLTEADSVTVLDHFSRQSTIETITASTTEDTSNTPNAPSTSVARVESPSSSALIAATQDGTRTLIAPLTVSSDTFSLITFPTTTVEAPAEPIPTEVSSEPKMKAEDRPGWPWWGGCVVC